MKMMTPEQIAAIFGCTAQQARDQLRKNSAQLSGMASKAAHTGRKVNQYTAAQLTERAHACIKAAL